MPTDFSLQVLRDYFDKSNPSVVYAFEDLCSRYGLDKDSPEGLLLWDNFKRRYYKESFTDEEILSDFLALGLAKMLRQLSFSKGAFSLSVGSLPEDYSNPLIVEVLRQSLTEALSAKVKKVATAMIHRADGTENIKGALILSKGFGNSGDQGRAFVIPCPKCNPTDKGFSRAELDALIGYEEKQKATFEKMQGNKERWEDNGKSRLPELGKIATYILNYLPEDWKETDKYNFIAEYMSLAGYLDFKPDDWKCAFDNKDRKEKDRVVRNWLKSYQDSLK